MTVVMNTQGGGGISVSAPTPADTAAILAMLGRCSRASLFHRFHGATDGEAYTLRMLGDPSIDTVIARAGDDCIGVASLVGDGTGGAELAVLVEDAWQRRRVGSLLVRHLVTRTPITRLKANVLGEDDFIVRSLRHLGPLRVEISAGTFSVDIDLGLMWLQHHDRAQHLAPLHPVEGVFNPLQRHPIGHEAVEVEAAG
jgi:GNAT superfamily N-acetyltransferase